MKGSPSQFFLCKVHTKKKGGGTMAAKDGNRAERFLDKQKARKRRGR